MVMKKSKNISLTILSFLILTAVVIMYSPYTKVTGFVIIEQKSEFDQGETFISVVSGNFIDRITQENILFFHDHVQIPMIYEVEKINEDFYIYALLKDKQPGNYSIIIRDVRYMKGSQITDEDIVEDFKINENIAYFYVNPGFVVTSEDFSLEVQNLQEEKITITLDSPEEFTAPENSFELSSGQIKEINFQINTNQKVLKKINLSSENTLYSVPVFLDLAESEEPESEESNLSFNFEPQKINVSMSTNSDSKRIVYILSTGGNVGNISLSVSSGIEEYVTVSPLEINSISKDSAEKIEISIESGDEEKNISGLIKAKAESETDEIFTTELSVFLEFLADFVPEEVPEEEIIVTTCAQLGGIICGEGEICMGETKSVKDGVCCLAPPICGEPKKTAKGKIIGWSIIILVLLFLFWFFKKYKRVRPKVDLLRVAAGRRRR